jgi:hypothetical protein
MRYSYLVRKFSEQCACSREYALLHAIISASPVMRFDWTPFGLRPDRPLNSFHKRVFTKRQRSLRSNLARVLADDETSLSRIIRDIKHF